MEKNKVGRKPGYSHDQDTKDKMRLAKYKPVDIFKGGSMVYKASSIAEAVAYLKTYRKAVYRSLTTGSSIRGYHVCYR